MAKPNYGFEKRQRELAKKRKQEAKRLKKTGAGSAAPAAPGSPGGEATVSSPADNTGAASPPADAPFDRR
ncbi:MAG: hypothetical protein IT531_06445 [Burkholderiales bacterium]|nr:hypothetical protein [Burkholderiales bacterium]